MNSFHNSPRAQCRRRVLVEEVRGSAAQQPSNNTSTGGEKKRASQRRYTDSALQSMQASISDFLPLRPWTLSVWLLSGITLIAGLLALYSQHSQWDRTIPRADLVAFDFAARGNLVAWFSSMSLVLSAAIMLAIYSVRQHRLDDYRGRFTIWLWAAGWAAFCSLDATAGLHHAIRGICVGLSGMTVHGDGSIWWVFVYSVLFGFLAVRLMVEMQPSRIALVSLLAAVLGYAISGLILLELVPTLVGRLATIAHVTGLLMGHLLLVFSLLTHARYVMMDARGQTRRRQRRAVVHQQEGGRRQDSGWRGQRQDGQQWCPATGGKASNAN